MGKNFSIRLDKKYIEKKRTSFGKRLFSSVHRGGSRCLDSSPVCVHTLSGQLHLPSQSYRMAPSRESDASCIWVALTVKHSQDRVAATG